jgi:hypothetical protein
MNTINEATGSSNLWLSDKIMILTAELNHNRRASKSLSGLTNFMLKKKQKEFNEHDGEVDTLK